MQDRIVIEIAKELGLLTETLLVVGYRYSRFGRVSFILNGIKPREADRILDPVVEELSLSIPGVKYVDIVFEVEVRSAVRAAKAVIATSLEFSRIVDEVVESSTSRFRWRTLRASLPRGTLRVMRKEKSASVLLDTLVGT